MSVASPIAAESIRTQRAEELARYLVDEEIELEKHMARASSAAHDGATSIAAARADMKRLAAMTGKLAQVLTDIEPQLDHSELRSTEAQSAAREAAASALRGAEAEQEAVLARYELLRTRPSAAIARQASVGLERVQACIALALVPPQVFV